MSPFTLPPALSMKAAISSPAYCRLTLGSWLRLMRPRPFGPRALNSLMASGVIGVCFSAERTAVAFADGIDGVEIHRQRGVQRVVGFVGVLDAGNAKIGRIIARVQHDAGDRLLADGRDQVFRERCQFLRNQERIAAAAHVEHPLVVEVEAGLEAVVAAKHLHRQPGRDDLGDRGRDERLRRRSGPTVRCRWRRSPAPMPAEQARRSVSLTSLTPARAGPGSRSKARMSRRDNMAFPATRVIHGLRARSQRFAAHCKQRLRQLFGELRRRHRQVAIVQLAEHEVGARRVALVEFAHHDAARVRPMRRRWRSGTR